VDPWIPIKGMGAGHPGLVQSGINAGRGWPQTVVAIRSVKKLRVFDNIPQPNTTRIGRGAGIGEWRCSDQLQLLNRKQRIVPVPIGAGRGSIEIDDGISDVTGFDIGAAAPRCSISGRGAIEQAAARQIDASAKTWQATVSGFRVITG
jgi:hypothetical protein